MTLSLIFKCTEMCVCVCACARADDQHYKNHSNQQSDFFFMATTSLLAHYFGWLMCLSFTIERSGNSI